MTNDHKDLTALATPVVLHIADRVLRVSRPATASTILDEMESCASSAELDNCITNVTGLDPADRAVLHTTRRVVETAEAGDAAALASAMATALDDLSLWQDYCTYLDDDDGRWEHVGSVSVDGGMLLVADPARVGRFDEDLDDEPVADAPRHRFSTRGAVNRIDDHGCGDIGDWYDGFVFPVADGLCEVLGRFEQDELVSVRLQRRVPRR